MGRKEIKGAPLLYLVACILILLSVFLKNNRALFLIWGFYFWILFGFNTSNPDYWAYSNIYKLFQWRNYDGKLADSGFIYLIKQGINFHLNYPQFLMIIALLSTILVFCFIYFFSDYRNLAPALLVFYPITLSIVQYRFYLASLIILVGVIFLSNEKKYSIPIFLISLLIASTIHFSSILYGLLLLSKWKNFKTIYAYILLAFLGLFLLSKFASLIHFASLSAAINKYIFASSNYKGLVFLIRVVVFRMIVILFVHFLLKYFRPLFKQRDFFLAKCINIIMMFTMVFEMVDSEFERYARIGYIMLYILLFNICLKMKLKSNTIIIISAFCIYLFSYMLFQYFLRSSNGDVFFDSVFRAIFENNSMIR